MLSVESPTAFRHRASLWWTTTATRTLALQMFVRAAAQPRVWRPSESPYRNQTQSDMTLGRILSKTSRSGFRYCSTPQAMHPNNDPGSLAYVHTREVASLTSSFRTNTLNLGAQTHGHTAQAGPSTARPSARDSLLWQSESSGRTNRVGMEWSSGPTIHRSPEIPFGNPLVNWPLTTRSGLPIILQMVYWYYIF